MFRQWGGTVAAILVASGLFGLAHAFTGHFGVAAFLGLTLNGIVWCICFRLSGSLALPIGMHAAWNFSQLYMFGLAMSGNAPGPRLIALEGSAPAIWSGGEYGPEAGIGGLIGMIVLMTLALVYAKLNGRLRPGD